MDLFFITRYNNPFGSCKRLECCSTGQTYTLYCGGL